MSFSDEVSKYHGKLSEAMAPHKGEILTNKEIKKILISSYPKVRLKEDWILPSDHCRNHTCKGGRAIVQCLTKRSLIEKEGVNTRLFNKLRHTHI